MKKLLPLCLCFVVMTSAAVEVYYELPAEKPPALVTHFDVKLSNTAKSYPGMATLPTPVCSGSPEEKAACLDAHTKQIVAEFDKTAYCKAYVDEKVISGQIIEWNQCDLTFTVPTCGRHEIDDKVQRVVCGSSATISYNILVSTGFGNRYMSGDNEHAFIVQGEAFNIMDYSSYSIDCPNPEVPQYTTYYPADFDGFVWGGDWYSAGVCGPAQEGPAEPQGVSAPLTELYDKTSGQYWSAQSNWNDEQIPVCQWQGVSCFEQAHESGPRNVINNIDLATNQPAGEVPESFYALVDALLAISPNFNWRLDTLGALGGPLPKSVLEMPNLIALLKNQPAHITRFGLNSCYPADIEFLNAFEGTAWQNYRCGQLPEAVACLESGTGPSCTAGNPINFRHGLKTEQAVDFSAGQGLSINRTYNSFYGNWWFNVVPRVLAVSSGGDWVTFTHDSGRQYTFDCRQANCYLHKSPFESGSAGVYYLSRTNEGFSLHRPDGGQFVYGLDGRLIKNINPNSTDLSYAYSDNQLVLSNDFGQSLTVRLGSGGAVEAIDTAIGAFSYEYDAAGRLVKMRRPDLSVIEYKYDESEHSVAIYRRGLLTGIINELGNRKATWHYDILGRGIQSSHGNGLESTQIHYVQELGYGYDSNGQINLAANAIRDIISPLGGKTRYHLDKNDSATLIEYFDHADTLLASESFSYNADGYLIEQIEKNGSVTRFTRSGHHVSTRIDGYGSATPRQTQFSYLANTDLVTQVTTDESITNYQYNSRQQVTEVSVFDRIGTTGQTRKTQYAYDEKGLLTQIDGPRTDVADITRFEYDFNGRRVKVINALGHVTEVLAFNNRNQPTKTKDDNGVFTDLGYDSRGALTTMTRQGLTTSYQYDETGKLTQVTLSDGQLLKYQYDSAGRLISTEDTLGNKQMFTLDSRGNRLKTEFKDAQGNLTYLQSQVFNSIGQLQQLVTAQGETTYFTYNQNGSLSDQTDAIGAKTRYEYNALAQLIKTVDPESHQTVFSPQTTGLNTAVVDAQGKTTHYQYNGFGEVIKQTSPDTGVTTFTYDLNGNLTVKTDALGRQSFYQYDALNRLISDSGKSATYIYDQGLYGIGKLTTILDLSGEQTLNYDAFGNVVTNTCTINGIDFTTEHQFDQANRWVATTYPDGRKVSYSYNALGQINKITATRNGQTHILAQDIQYLPFGPVTGWIYGNGLSHALTFDLSYKATEQLVGSSNTTFSYTARGNLAEIANSNQTQTFNYSATQRLTDANGIYGTISYDYDGIGNRLNKTFNSQSEEYQYATDSHQLQQANDRIFSYNAVGQTTQINNLQLNYDIPGRMSAAINGSTGAFYTYNALNQRVKKQTLAGEVTYYLYDLQGQLIGEANSQGVIIKSYIYFNNQLLAMYDNALNTTPPPEDLVFDDSDTSVTKTGSWTVKSARKALNGSHQVASGNSGAALTYKPNLVGGTYQLYARWLSNKKRNRAAQYRINHNGQSTPVTADQTANGNQWNLLGEFLFDGQSVETITLNDSGGKVSADGIRLIRIADLPPQQDKLYFAHNNHIYTPTKLTNETGATVWQASYTPFGLGTPNDDIDGNGKAVTLNIRFPGQYYDSETGLHYNWHRYYDPKIGRYLQSDPIGLDDGPSTYGYVQQNPVNGRDPIGLKTCLLTVKSPAGLGLHSALYLSNVEELYDPSGSYGVNNGGEVLIGQNHLFQFLLYHHEDGDSIDVNCKDTNESQERKISNAILEEPTSFGPNCAIGVSHVLNNSGVLGSFDTIWLPNNLLKNYIEAQLEIQ